MNKDITSLKKAGISTYKISDYYAEDIYERIAYIIRISKEYRKNEFNMLYFVMYDIRSNKVRKLISNYLINKGCHRVQKSIFLGQTHINIFNNIKKTLATIQASYHNQDSILVVPINNDLLNSMKIIGKDINIDIINNNKNTLFF